MASIFLRNLNIKNFRAFGDSSPSILLNTPDGKTPGSGLTVLVGENGSGKTTVLEATELLVKNTFAARARVSVGDFPNIDKKIEIKAETTQDFDVKRLWGGNSFAASGFYFYANVRNKDESARLLDPIALDNEFIQSANSNVDLQDVEKRLGATGPYGTDRVPLRVHYFDKNRSRHLVGGKYQTKFDDALGDLNFQFLKWLRSQSEEDKTKIAGQVSTAFEGIHQSVNDKVVSKAFEQITKLVGDYNLKLDFANLLEPYNSASIYSRRTDGLEQIPVGKLGSGIEMICSLVFLDTIYQTTSTTALYCIDEPEMHLHPQLQVSLFNYLQELSKKKQVIISTHSPEFISLNTLPNTVKLSTIDGEVKQSRISDAVAAKIRPNRNFFERHKPLLFANKAIFVEGPDDLERYALFAEDNGFGDLVPHMFMMNGKDATRLYEAICNCLDIKFAAIVDRDFCYELSLWERQRAQRFLARVKDAWPDFDLDGFKAKHCNQDAGKARGGKDAPVEVEVDGVVTIQASQGDIFVLSSGEVMDYLEKDGSSTDDNKKKELLAILGQIRTALG